MTPNSEPTGAANGTRSDDAEAASGKPDHERQVTIDNKDSGDTLKLRRSESDTIDSIIATMYADFRLTREQDDRLQCRGNGKDVFQFGSLALAQYLQQGHCPDLHWSFVGGTGGA